MVTSMAARVLRTSAHMNTVSTLDRPGYRLGERLERPLDANPPSALKAMDQRLLFKAKQFGSWRDGDQNFSGELEQIHRHWDLFEPRTDAELTDLWNSCREELARCACLAEFVRRETGLKAHDEQLYAAWLIRNEIWVEMATGEGKSLVAVLAAAWVASEGVAAHVVTTNDYLVQRDATKFAPVYKRAGLTVAAVLSDLDDQARQRAYEADVVYVTGKQIGFDYLRDCMGGHNGHGRLRNKLRALMPMATSKPIQRGLEFAIIDEIDSVVIDDARTPLILANATAAQATPEQYAEAAVGLGLAAMLQEDTDFTINAENNAVVITNDGKEKLQSLSNDINGAWLFARFRNEKVRQALVVMHALKLDRDYIVRDGDIELIDQATGRSMPDRQLPHGMHQMLEAHVGSSLSAATQVQLSITFRGLFSRYRHLAGMSGTLKGLERELNASYGADCAVVPRHAENKLRKFPALMFGSSLEQTQWLVKEVEERTRMGQPVLLGVRTVEESEALSTVLNGHGVSHFLINAAHDSEEAEIVAKAGQTGSVTVATNMAGRGTDIPLSDAARAAGGLHVICLSLNESKRTERQLFGRSARQGDPGSCQRVLSFDDPLLKQYVPLRLGRLCDRIGQTFPRIGRCLGQAIVFGLQRHVERRYEIQREYTWRHNQDIERRLAYGINKGTRGNE